MLILAHETPNRMRFNSPALRVDHGLAAELVESVRAVPAVTDVQHNTLTGSLIVHHRGGSTARDTILERLTARTVVSAQSDPVQRIRPSAVLAPLAAESIAAAVMDAVVKRLVGHGVDALVAAIL
ncbi:MAG TPA: hypothetical protein VHO91_03765 [Rhodopila sp.]|nr:hypothetical protein [Rhodopila sp.]